MVSIKRAIKAGFRRFGLEVKRLPSDIGHDPYRDMKRLTFSIERPVIFDVGANAGQSVDRIRSYFAHPIIHAFEPSPDTFKQLQKATKAVPDLVLNNLALGRYNGTADLVENTESVMSSLLEFGPDSWGSVKKKTPVAVSTLDEYCTGKMVESIDILKLDTQGFELEVLNGGENLFSQGRVSVVFMEITFSEMYQGLPSLDVLYRFMIERGFLLVAFYDIHYQNNRLGWCDALFTKHR
jgi:FkbM family methyltransferase